MVRGCGPAPQRFIISSDHDNSAHRGGLKESGIGRENGVEAFESCKGARDIEITG